MTTPTSSGLSQIRKAHNANNSTPAQPHSPVLVPSAPPTAPKIAEIPARMRELEPAVPPLVAVDDPVFNTPDAAQILGLTADRLMKWRERGQGPQYLQYEDGPVRYELSALIEFKAAHRVRPPRQPHPGRRSCA